MPATLPASRPRGSHLSAPALARLRDLLLVQVRENADQASRHEATARQLNGQTDADSAIERELAISCAVRAREAIEEASEALDRLAAGTYGTCLACRQEIPFERLEAIPHARFCVTCPRPPGLRRL